MILTCEEQQLAFSIVRNSIDHGFDHDAARLYDPALFSDKFKLLSQVFVSLKYKGVSVGCQGNFGDSLPFYKALSNCSFNAGFNDPRFPAINKNILSQLVISIHLLGNTNSTSAIFDIEEFCSKLDSDDCVLLRSHDKKAFFLSSVQSEYTTKMLFMLALKNKANIDNKTPWYFLNATTVKTLSTYSQSYQDTQ
jgi:hypothetical protein